MSPALRPGWLLDVVRRARPGEPLAPPPLGDPIQEEAWLDGRLRARRAGVLLADRREGKPSPDEAERARLLEAHAELMAGLVADLFAAPQGAPGAEVRAPPAAAAGARATAVQEARRLAAVAAALAGAVGDDVGLAEAIERSGREAPPATEADVVVAGKETAELLRHLERALDERLLPARHPLWGSPLHRPVLRADAALVGRIALDLAAGRLAGPEARMQAHRRRAQAALARQAFVEAALGMAQADHSIARSERRSLRRLAEVARLPAAELKILLDLAPEEPRSVEDIAARVRSPGERQALLALVLEMGLVDGALGPEERDYYHRMAEALQLDAGARIAIHATVGERLRVAPAPAAWATARLARLEGLATRDLRRLIQRHASAIRRELEETGDLLELLARSATRELTPDERRRAREQLLDLVRAVPALAILATPGGSLLLPVLARLLPLDLRLSAWREQGAASSPTGGSRPARTQGDAAERIE